MHGACVHGYVCARVCAGAGHLPEQAPAAGRLWNSHAPAAGEADRLCVLAPSDARVKPRPSQTKRPTFTAEPQMQVHPSSRADRPPRLPLESPSHTQLHAWRIRVARMTNLEWLVQLLTSRPVYSSHGSV